MGMDRREHHRQSLLDACGKCCDTCVGEGYSVLYCMEMCGCSCDGLFDDVDCNPYAEDCGEEYELDDICGEDSELDPLCHGEDEEDEWW